MRHFLQALTKGVGEGTGVVEEVDGAQTPKVRVSLAPLTRAPRACAVRFHDKILPNSTGFVRPAERVHMAILKGWKGGKDS